MVRSTCSGSSSHSRWAPSRNAAVSAARIARSRPGRAVGDGPREQGGPCEPASSAALSIDNAVLHQHIRSAAKTLQRSLLPRPSPRRPGLQIAARYRPAQAFSEVGGDWYDIIPLSGDRTALAVGDVMGGGIPAATAMGRLRTATSTLADLDLAPSRILTHLDKITQGLDPCIATCVYAVYDPHERLLHVACAGHLPPVLGAGRRTPRTARPAHGHPLGAGSGPFETSTLAMNHGDQLILYTDGLVETRDSPIDKRLDHLLRLPGPTAPVRGGDLRPAASGASSSRRP
ncbi:PP2C family protein-serine/threonine phosphatase [Streptomyces massasporeus]|uniref:PP2C family protein-serine/threonine phosphatase n=1 Tax=Streptomyces massasporeus TaxID=67324 RepID=UPI0037A3FFC1